MRLVSEIIAKLPAWQQAKIKARTDSLINEYLAATADEVVSVKRDGTITRRKKIAR